MCNALDGLTVCDASLGFCKNNTQHIHCRDNQVAIQNDLSPSLCPSLPWFTIFRTFTTIDSLCKVTLHNAREGFGTCPEAPLRAHPGCCGVFKITWRIQLHLSLPSQRGLPKVLICVCLDISDTVGYFATCLQETKYRPLNVHHCKIKQSRYLFLKIHGNQGTFLQKILPVADINPAETLLL